MKTITTQKMTVQHAIEKGYTHYCEEEGELASLLADLNEDYMAELREQKTKCYLVDINKPKHFTISANQIKTLITDFVNEQDEMADEDCKLGEIAEAHDYAPLAAELNEGFAKHKFYEPTDIELIF